jgi:diguanylate cyclase (GGDEF)-like protein
VTSLRRRTQRSGLFTTERPPRLVLRFAAVLSLALGLASAAILVVVHHFAISEAERSATRQASLIASTVFQHEVKSGDLARPVPTTRRKELDALFGKRLLAEDTLGVSLVRTDGLVTYSTDHRAIGSHMSGTLASEAAKGTIVSRTSTAGGGGAPADTKTLETYTPVSGDARRGSALIVQSYAPIDRAARSVQLRVGVVLEILLLVLFLLLVPLLSRVTKRIKRQIDQIHFQAFYDELTGLPNRAHVFQQLKEAVRRANAEERTLAVLLLDLDRFREINNTLGHDAGDKLLAEIAGRLHTTVGSDVLLARLGGDEFAVVVEYEKEDDATTFAERIRQAVEPPVIVGDVPLAVDGTVGIAFYPKDGDDAEALLKHAEVAMQTAKQWRVGTLAYSPAVDPHDPEQLKLVAALRKADERDELSLHYQRKVDLVTSATVGFEVLTYWQHPTRGLLPPGAFIPVAERTGSIRHLSKAVLGRAVAQIARWKETGMEATVAVNLTPVDLLDLDLPQQLDELLRESGVDPQCLCIEVTESSVMADPERAKAILDDIVAIGIRVSIDDFGTGHSSLAYLKDLPVHEVKIDRSFIFGMAASPHDRLIVQATIQLAHSLGFQVVAEGVETAEVTNALREMGCDYAQGYFYGRPEPAEAVNHAAQALEAA